MVCQHVWDKLDTSCLNCTAGKWHFMTRLHHQGVRQASVELRRCIKYNLHWSCETLFYLSWNTFCYCSPKILFNDHIRWLLWIYVSKTKCHHWTFLGEIKINFHTSYQEATRSTVSIKETNLFMANKSPSYDMFVGDSINTLLSSLRI